jgi:XTP/dITP diphosphohydrolase
MRGLLATEPRGTNGFGYDPILVPDEAAPGDASADRRRTAAELEPEEKNAISHRGKAFRALAPVVLEVLGG